MRHNRHKKQSADRKRLENSLIKDLGPLSARGTFFDSCVQKDIKDKKYNIAKKRYIDVLDDAEEMIKKIRKMIDSMESESSKEQKRAKLSEQDTKRNNHINGVPDEI